MYEQYIGCISKNLDKIIICDDIIICDSVKKECCIPVRDIFLIVDLEKHVNGKLALSSYFNYTEDHADFLLIKREGGGLVLEIIEFEKGGHRSEEEKAESKSKEDSARDEELIKDGILLQLLYFYAKIKKLLEEKLGLKVFSNVENVKLLIVVPQGIDEKARDILNELKHDYRKVLSDFLSQYPKRSPRLKEKLDEVKLLIISTREKIIDRIAVAICENFTESKA